MLGAGASVRAPDGSVEPGRPPGPWAVGALVRAIAAALQQGFGACTVRGEIGSFSRAGSGHCYFMLKDADGDTAALRCAMFRRAASLLDFAPGDGQLVEARGRLALYEPRGELQLIVESLRPAGAGALYEQFLRLRARLDAEGLFDDARKRPWPTFPRCIGIVTSRDAAALRDVVSAFARRSPHVKLRLYPSPVQGAEAPAALVAALELAARRAEVDAVLVCRGGGSIEDLWAFNDERVVRAIAACPLPVACGIGHATDLTLADLAADLSAPTPTAAAELAAPPTAVCVEHLSALQARLQRRLQQLLDTHELRLDRAALRLARPHDLLQRQARTLALLSHRLEQTLPMQLQRRRDALQRMHDRGLRAAAASCAQQAQRLDLLAARLDAVDPRRVLRRGYAWLSAGDGLPVTSARALAEGDPVRAVLADGSADAVVTRVKID